MKKMFTILCSACLVLAVALPSIFAEEAPTEAIELAYFPNLKVIFPHDKHADLQCEACHHMWDGKAAVQSCTDSGCHDVFDKKDKTEKSFYNVIHGKGTAEVQSCLGCHREEAKKNKDMRKQLTSCKGSGCHP